MATASTVAAAGRAPASRPASQASPYAGRAAAIHTIRYPDANPASRRPRSSPKVRIYKDANGVTDGNIIAAIISVAVSTSFGPTYYGGFQPSSQHWPLMAGIVPALTDDGAS